MEMDSQAAAPLKESPEAPKPMDLSEAAEVAERIRARVRYDVMGRDEVIELTLISLFAGGHVLLEDYPGSGKTTLAKALGHSITDEPSPDQLPEFRRMQFTPDLLPSDITGVMIFDTDSNQFHFRRGPIFAYIVLVDEINRTTPKVQAALLESMAEQQVTVDNVTHPLDELFFVIATQNPLDSVGTYPLPLAQLDRFLFKIKMEHVERAAELEVLSAWGKPRPRPDFLPKVSRSEIVEARQLLRTQVQVSSAIHECLVDLARTLREDKRCRQGVSTRSLVQAIPALQTRAMLRRRDYVSSEDIEALMVPLFRHRLSLVAGIEDPRALIFECLRGPMERLCRSSLR